MLSTYDHVFHHHGVPQAPRPLTTQHRSLQSMPRRVTSQRLQAHGPSSLAGSPRPYSNIALRTPTSIQAVEVDTPSVPSPLSSPTTQAWHKTAGSDSGAYDWFDHWYPIAFERDVDESKPYRFVLMEIPLVIWWDPVSSQWRAFTDQCPHRFVPLSEGRINQNGRLECGYHGWEFNGAGACTRIPQEGNLDNPRACAVSFPCAVKQGLIFVYPKPGASADESKIQIVPELEDPSWSPGDTWRDLPMDYATLLENVLDSSHVPFTHHKTMSNRNMIGKHDFELTEGVTLEGFGGKWATGPRGGRLGSQTTEFKPPMYMKHKLEGSIIDSLVVVYSVPTSPGRCRLINRNVVRFKKNPLPSLILSLLPKWRSHLGSHVLLEDDQIFLHIGELDIAKKRAEGMKHSQVCYMPSRADTYIIAFQRWLGKFGNGGPFGPINKRYLELMGPRLGRDELLNRYTQHTQQCATCQKGLRTAQRALQLLTFASGAAFSLAVICTSIALAPAAPAAAPISPSDVATALQSSSAAGWLSSAASAVGSALVPAVCIVKQVLLGCTPSEAASRAVTWAVLALVALWGKDQAARLESSFYRGVYPPPRNAVKD